MLQRLTSGPVGSGTVFIGVAKSEPGAISIVRRLQFETGALLNLAGNIRLLLQSQEADLGRDE